MWEVDMDWVQVITVILVGLTFIAATRDFITSEKFNWGMLIFVVMIMIPFARVLELL